MIRISGVLSVLVCFLGALCAFGQVHADSVRMSRDSVDMSGEMEQVVVTATRTARPLKEIPVITQVVPRREIERMAPRSANDLLELALPGVQTTEHGQQERMTIQGLSSDYYLIMVDGVPLSVDDGTVDLTRIDPNSIERVEVVQGASSALYGSSAIGAVINFITRKGQDPFEATVKGMYDSRGEQLYNGFLSFRHRGFRSTSSGGVVYHPAYELGGLRDLGRPGTVGRVKVPWSGSWNARQYFSYSPESDRYKVDVRGSYNYRVQGRSKKEEFLYGTLNVGGSALYKLSDSYDLDFSYNLESYERDLHWIKRKEIEHVFSFQTHNGRLQLNAKPFGAGGPIFNAGFQTLEEGLRSARLSLGEERRHVSTSTLYGQTDWDLLPSVRVTLGTRVDFHSAFGAHITPRAALLWKLGLVQLRVSYAEGFRSPSVKELYMFWDHLGMFELKGNAQLKPERSRMFILAPELNYGTLNVTLQGYYNAVTDRIYQAVEDEGLTLKYRNALGVTRLSGASAMARWRAIRGLSLSLNYAYVYDYVEGKDFQGRRVNLSTTRPHSVTGGVTYKVSYWKMSTSVDVLGRYLSGFTAGYNVRGKVQNHTFAGYGNLRASVTQSYRNYAHVTLGCENLLDYRPNQLNVATSLSPGRSFYVALSLNI